MESSSFICWIAARRPLPGSGAHRALCSLAMTGARVHFEPRWAGSRSHPLERWRWVSRLDRWPTRIWAAASSRINQQEAGMASRPPIHRSASTRTPLPVMEDLEGSRDSRTADHRERGAADSAESPLSPRSFHPAHLAHSAQRSTPRHRLPRRRSHLSCRN